MHRFLPLVSPVACALLAGCLATKSDHETLSKAMDQFQIDLNLERQHVATMTQVYRDISAWKSGIDGELKGFQTRLDGAERTIQDTANLAVVESKETLRRVEQDIVPKMLSDVNRGTSELTQRFDAQNAQVQQLSAEVAKFKTDVDAFQNRFDGEILRLSKILRAADADAIKLSNLQVQRQLLEKERGSVDARLADFSRQIAELETALKEKDEQSGE